ncbi:MAG: hypothetical protein JWO66_1033 [Candidatus Eremiobacteraeota bacterium]|nr:hypothetical protein [Candidatus Eremiobacteraeota bacterium]
MGSRSCSIARTLDVVGDWWTLLVLRDVFRGIRRFDELKHSLDVATNVLALRLKRLTDAGILERTAYQEHPPRYEYAPTDKGRDLYPVLIALLQYGDRHLRGDDAPPRVVVHETCGKATQPSFVCPHCSAEVSASNARTVSRADLPRTLAELRRNRGGRAAARIHSSPS